MALHPHHTYIPLFNKKTCQVLVLHFCFTEYDIIITTCDSKRNECHTTSYILLLWTLHLYSTRLVKKHQRPRETNFFLFYRTTFRFRLYHQQILNSRSFFRSVLQKEKEESWKQSGIHKQQKKKSMYTLVRQGKLMEKEVVEKAKGKALRRKKYSCMHPLFVHERSCCHCCNQILSTTD